MAQKKTSRRHLGVYLGRRDAPIPLEDVVKGPRP
jgi:hypothetical protein